MNLELIEDGGARAWREREMRREARPAARACLVFGLPLSLFTALVLYLLPADQKALVAMPVLAPLAMWLALLVLPAINRVFRNRWGITDSGIRLRGQCSGSVRWRKVRSWSVRTDAGLPGYYQIRLATRFSTANILVSEQGRPRHEMEDFFRSRTKTEPNAAGDAGLRLSLFPRSRARRA
jgi:hypothetical protein